MRKVRFRRSRKLIRIEEETEKWRLDSKFRVYNYLSNRTLLSL